MSCGQSNPCGGPTAAECACLIVPARDCKAMVPSNTLGQLPHGVIARTLYVGGAGVVVLRTPAGSIVPFSVYDGQELRVMFTDVLLSGAGATTTAESLVAYL